MELRIRAFQNGSMHEHVLRLGPVLRLPDHINDGVNALGCNNAARNDFQLFLQRFPLQNELVQYNFMLEVQVF